MIMNDEFENMWREEVVAKFKGFPGIFMEGLRKR
jgi:hypothetical protein